MGKIMKEMYYYEPNVQVIGKYGQELTVDFILNIYKNMTEKYRERLNRVEIEYKKRKDGVKAAAILQPHRNYYENYRPEMDRIKIFFACTEKLPAKKIWIWPDGKIDTFIFDTETGEYVSQPKPAP